MTERAIYHTVIISTVSHTVDRESPSCRISYNMLRIRGLHSDTRRPRKNRLPDALRHLPQLAKIQFVEGYPLAIEHDIRALFFSQPTSVSTCHHENNHELVPVHHPLRCLHRSILQWGALLLTVHEILRWFVYGCTTRIHIADLLPATANDQTVRRHTVTAGRPKTENGPTLILTINRS